MYAWPAEIAVGRIAYELLKTETPQPLEEIEPQLLQRGHWEGEVIYYTRDGARLNVSTRWALQREVDGTPVRVLAINQNITDRKQAEEALFVEKERSQVTLNSIWRRRHLHGHFRKYHVPEYSRRENDGVAVAGSARPADGRSVPNPGWNKP
jgi:hypothetical protein